MQGIEVTLLRNKQYVAQNQEDYKVIGNENNATTILVHFPEEYESYSKRVDFKNIRNEKWTIALYTPEDETLEYGSDFDKNQFAFTLPRQVTTKGELKVQFVAYLPDETQTIVPFEILKIDIKDDIMYAKKGASDTPDLILKAYEYSNMALEISREAISRSENAERAALESEHSAKIAEECAKNAQQSATESLRNAKDSNDRANETQASASAAEQSALNSERSAKLAEDNSKIAVNTSNSANAKSSEAVNTANASNEKSTKALDIVDNITVSSTEKDCKAHINVSIETNEQTKHKNIHFDIPAPKQGTSYRSRGPWESDIEYINDSFYIDTVSRHGCTYYCKVSNVGNEPLASTDTGYWGLVADKGAALTIVDNLESDHADYALSAKQGKVLKVITDDQNQRIKNLTNNTNIISNGNGGFSCGRNAKSDNGMSFKTFTICNENGDIPAARLFNAIYPVGSIYFTTSPTNPSILFGGEWESYAQGRTIIGTGSSDLSFVIGETGGESIHTLIESEMPSHTHTQNGHKHDNSISIGEHDHTTYIKTRTSKAGISNDYGSTGDHVCGQINGSKTYINWAKTDPTTPEYSINNAMATATNNNTGGSQPHNNLPPYIVTYIWRRIA